MKRILVIGCPGGGKEHLCPGSPGPDRSAALVPGSDLGTVLTGTTVSRAEFDAQLTGCSGAMRGSSMATTWRTLDLRLRQRIPPFCWTTPPGSAWRGCVPRIGIKPEDLPWVEEEF